MMEWTDIKVNPETEIDVLLISKDGCIFSGYLKNDSNNNYKVITRYELQSDGYYKPFYSTINRSYFSYWANVD